MGCSSLRCPFTNREINKKQTRTSFLDVFTLIGLLVEQVLPVPHRHSFTVTIFCVYVYCARSPGTEAPNVVDAAKPAQRWLLVACLTRIRYVATSGKVFGFLFSKWQCCASVYEFIGKQMAARHLIYPVGKFPGVTSQPLPRSTTRSCFKRRSAFEWPLCATVACTHCAEFGLTIDVAEPFDSEISNWLVSWFTM